MEHPPEPAEDDKNPRPLDHDGREIALRSPRLGNTHAPHQYSNSESESDGYHDASLDNLPSQQYRSLGVAIKAIKAELEQLRIKNMGEAEDIQEKLSTTVGESEEVNNLHLAEYINCYNKMKAVNDQSARRRAVICAELKCMLNRVYGGEEVSVEEQIRCLEKIAEIGQRPVSLPSMSGH